MDDWFGLVVLITVVICYGITVNSLDKRITQLEKEVVILTREQNVIFNTSRDTMVFSLVTHGYSVERAEEIASVIHALKDVHELHRVWRG